jgi:uncharacterized protein
VSWNGQASNYTNEQYAAACVLDRGPDAGTVKQRYSLPVRDPSGALNCDGVSAAKARLNQVTGATDEQIAAARRKLDALSAQCEKRSRPLGEFEERQLELSTDGQRIRGRIPYGTLSADMGGWREVIEPTALRSTNLDNLVVTVDHGGLPLGRYPRTLELEDRADGMHWSVDPPASRADVVEAVRRGDLNGGSWRMRVQSDRWEGDTRYVTAISELRDVSIVTHPSYPAAAVELRNQPEESMSETLTTPEAIPEPAEEPQEARSAPDPGPTPPEPSRPSAGSLRIEARTSDNARGTLVDCFRSQGWSARDGEKATIPWTEFEDRAVTWTAPVTSMNMMWRQGAPYGFDVRFAWPAFPRLSVGADVTSANVPQQTARSLPAPAHRAIDATTTKPEVGSTFNILQVPLEQVPGKQSGIPNVYLLQPLINSIIERDLTFQINSHLDFLVLGQLATAGFHDPTPDKTLFDSIRLAVETLQSAGYFPNVLLLDPASATALHLARATAADNFFQFAPSFAPDAIFGLNRRIAKGIPHPIVVDTDAFGTLYASPVQLSRWEENFGQTNTSTVRLECHACFGIERPGAAIRIAAS